jgi:type IV secretory pathway TraG/TraD family ATPase VirD4
VNYVQLAGWFGAALAVACVLGWLVGTFAPNSVDRETRRQNRVRESSRTWARPADLGELAYNPARDDRSRLQLGVLGNAAVANPPRRSVIAVAPTGAGKTPRYAAPFVLRHKGPAVVTSVKADILHLTLSHRASQGPVWVFDVTGISGLPGCRWSPLTSIHSYADAMKAASWIANSTKADQSGIENANFWDTLGEKLLAPLLFAAAHEGRHIADVARWVDTGEEKEVLSILGAIGDRDAEAQWLASMKREARTKQSVFATAEVVLQPFAHPQVRDALTATADAFSPARLLDEGGTLYLVAPQHDQELFAPIFETIINAVVREVEMRSAANQGLPIDPSLLLCLDELANIARVRKLDQIASAGANQGITLASFIQDLGQLAKIYGPDTARTIMANHTAKVFLTGNADVPTLEMVSALVGQHKVRNVDVTRDMDTGTPILDVGRRSARITHDDADVAPISWLREQPEDVAIVITGRSKPMRLRAPGWWEQPELARLVDARVRERFAREFETARR